MTEIIKILDTSFFSEYYSCKNNRKEDGSYINRPDGFYITDDIKKEMDLSPGDNDKLMSGLINIITGKSDKEKQERKKIINYYANYKHFLNSYKAVSFYNMTGFGDVSILALVKSLLEKNTACPTLFEQPIHVYTKDRNLQNELRKEFKGIIIVRDDKINSPIIKE